MHELRKKAVSAFLWKFGDKLFGQLSALVVAIVLARLLTPEEFGTVALVRVFVVLGMVVVEHGLGPALVQKKELREEEMHSALWANLALSLLLFALLFFAAPLIARLSGRPGIALLCRVLAAELPLGALSSIVTARLQRELRFKRISIAGIVSTLLAGVAAILAALRGLGVWALVMQQLLQRSLGCLLLWLQSRYRPRLRLSRERLRALLGYGWKLFAAKELQTLFLQLRSLVVGTLFSPAALAFFNRGEQFPALIYTATDHSLQQVMLPLYAQRQNEPQELRRLLQKTLQTSAFFLCPILLGLFAVADRLVALLLTEKWLPCVPYLRILCLAYLIAPLGTANTQALNALGRSDLTLRTELQTRAFSLAALAAGAALGLRALAAVSVAVELCYALLRGRACAGLLGYSLREQGRDFLPPAALAAAMAALVLLLGRLPLTTLPLLLLQILFGALLYALGAWAFRMPGWRFVCELWESKVNHNKYYVNKNKEDRP